MKKPEILEAYDEFILPIYSRMPGIFVKGKGMALYDIDGKKYLDFFPGWGVNNVGHCHPKVMAGVRNQIGKLIFIPNNLYHPFAPKLAKEIVRWSFPAKVFFCNSGTEACEAAIKFSRVYGKGERFEIISMHNSFHGRTLGAVSATGQKKYQDPFHPLLPGFKTIEFNNLGALKNALTEKTIAVLLELVQGEGGVHVASKEYIQEVRRICDEKNLLFILDEVQTGMGRTGEMFAFKHFGITPDLMILAKSLGGGLPIGALVVKKELSDVLKPGMHASTFGGSPLICQASLGAFKAIVTGKMLQNVKVMGPYLMKKAQILQQKYPFMAAVRGLGLMVGIQLSIEGKSIVEDCFASGLIINCTQGNILRLMPALNVTQKEVNKAMAILDLACSRIK